MKFRKPSNPSSRSRELLPCAHTEPLLIQEKRLYFPTAHKFTVHKIPFHLLNKRDDEGAIEFQFHVKKLVLCYLRCMEVLQLISGFQA